MQLCVNVQTPEELDGVQGCAIYIDTEGGLVMQRLQEVAGAFVEQCTEKLNIGNFHFDYSNQSFG